MNLRSRFGYLILALKQYPFEKEIKERIEEIEVPWKPTDPNTGIKSNKVMTPKALADIIKKESDPELHRLDLMKKAISEVKESTPAQEWLAIKEVYIDNTLTVEGASIKYLHCSKSFAYKKVIEPFFKNLETKIYELSLSKKFNISVEKS
mgnify:CR=1 FL=1